MTDNAFRRGVAPLVWTPELIARFWDGMTETRLGELNFSRLAGPFLLGVLQWHLERQGRHIDFGSGDGDFVRVLAENGFRAGAYEPARQRESRVAQRLGGMPNFLGIYGPESPETFDTVFLIEVIEHILDDLMPQALDRMHRLLKPGGKLIVTTPNAEDLDLGMAYSPVDGTLFHRWQHVHSFTVERLTELLRAHRFEPIVVHQLEISERVFSCFGSGVERTPEWAGLFETEQPLYIGDAQHVIWIGRRVEGPSQHPVRALPPFVLDPQTAFTPRQGGLSGTPPGQIGLSRESTEIAPILEYGIDPTEMVADQGHSWSVDIHAAFGRGDLPGSPANSTVRLYQNGVPLPLARNPVEAVRREGRGRYGHWNGRLFFSSTDNEPPSRNGRRYVVTGPPAQVEGAAGTVGYALSAARMSRSAGLSWTIPLPEDLGPADTVEMPRSRITLFEDGVPLGPAHSPHSAIQEQGGGAFSHWGDGLIFSTSDGTDPAQNGRRYVVQAPDPDLRNRREGNPGSVMQRLLPARMHHRGGFSWTVSLSRQLGPGDTADDRSSVLVLFEDGVPLGPAHSDHLRIAQDGAGAYSHWGGELIFSSSDGTPPDGNGRRYVAQAPIQAHRAARSKT